jgi:hypothetical protein
MKHLLSLSFFFSLLFLFTAFNQTKISSSEAKTHIGENDIFTGVAKNVRQTKPIYNSKSQKYNLNRIINILNDNELSFIIHKLKKNRKGY